MVRVLRALADAIYGEESSSIVAERKRELAVRVIPVLPCKCVEPAHCPYAS